MKTNIATIFSLATVFADVASESFLDTRELSANSLSFYGYNLTIPYSPSLGCGVCIKEGYNYCIPGLPGSDPSTRGIGNPVCCSDASCVQS